MIGMILYFLPKIVVLMCFLSILPIVYYRKNKKKWLLLMPSIFFLSVIVLLTFAGCYFSFNSCLRLISSRFASSCIKPIGMFYNPPHMFLLYFCNFSLKILLVSIPYDIKLFLSGQKRFLIVKMLVVIDIFLIVAIILHFELCIHDIIYGYHASDFTPEIHILTTLFPHL